jgi:hypothetical protein
MHPGLLLAVYQYPFKALALQGYNRALQGRRSVTCPSSQNDTLHTQATDAHPQQNAA